VTSSRPVEEWVKRLSLPEEKARAEAMKNLGELLSSDEEETRDATARVVLQELARPDCAVSEPLVVLLRDCWLISSETLVPEVVKGITAALARVTLKDPLVEKASLVLLDVSHRSATCGPLVSAQLDHPSATVRRVMVKAASELGPESRTYLPKLIAHLDDPSEDVVAVALEAVGSVGILDPGLAAPALVAQVRRRTGSGRYVALSGLHRILERCHEEEEPLPKLPGLVDVLKDAAADPTIAVRQELAFLLRVPELATVPGILALARGLLQDPKPFVASFAAVALLNTPETLPEALELLEKQLHSKDVETQMCAVGALEGSERDVLLKAREMLRKVARSAKEPLKQSLRELIDKAGQT
jgi:HEAT repeat protein